MPKNRSFALHCLRQHGINFNLCDVVGPKATEFGKIVQKTAITLFKVMQGQQIWYQWKANMSLLVWVTYQISTPNTQYLGVIFADDRGCLSLMHSLGSTPKSSIAKFGLMKLDALIPSIVWTEVYFNNFW